MIFKKAFSLQIVVSAIFLLSFSTSSKGLEENMAVGVVPFSITASEGSSSYQIAEKLVQRLTTSGLGEVRVLSDYGALLGSEIDRQEVKRVAEKTGVDMIVLGRTAKLGNRLSFDGEIRSGLTGERIGNSFFVEAPAGDDLTGPVDALAARVMEQIPENLIATASEAESSAPSLLSQNSDDPVSIKSRELEAIENQKGRTLIFTGDVRVVQGSMTLTSENAEAYYPPGSSHPESMKARGQVVIRSEGRVARCEEATFRQAENVMVCREHARIDEGCDRITADEIRFNTKTEKFSASGNVQVQMNREGSSCGDVS